MEEVENVISCHPSPAVTDRDPRKSQESATAVLGWTTCYIVCGLVIRDGKVLMIQEAKSSCRGKWYMPAGRMERRESLETAVKREVKEESGHDFEPKALIAIEFQSLNWVRFTFVGDITGGELKTPDQEDKESIQAQWMTADITKLMYSSLRAKDCLKLIDLANKWHKEDIAHRYQQLSVAVSHVNPSLRVVLIRQNGDELFVFLRDTPFPGCSMRIPCCACGRGSPMEDIKRLLSSCGYNGEYKIHGLLSVEHKVEGGDGIGLSVLLSCSDASIQGGCGFSWEPVKNLDDRLKMFMSHEYPLIHLIDLWF